MRLLIFFLLLSSACFGQVRSDSARRADKDSAYKYWKLFTAFHDSAIDAHDKGNLLHFNYWHKKELWASRISYKYAEKQ